MKKNTKPRRESDGMRAEYDFSKGMRGKYAARYREGTNVILLDADVAKQFKDSKAVNRALRGLLENPPAARRRRSRSA